MKSGEIWAGFDFGQSPDTLGRPSDREMVKVKITIIITIMF